MPAVTETYDAVVVGASFAGLAFAGAAAARGLRVLVVERDAEVGRVDPFACCRAPVIPH